MSEKQAWFITGAGRGMGVDFAKAALAAGNAVVATGRRPETVLEAVGDAEDLLVVRLDVTRPAEADAAVQAAVERFGRIDVLVNNAANFYGGYFEELTPAEIADQLATALIGPMNVTRAVLPVMRRQRSGHVVSISSGAGLSGFEFNSAYSAEPFGINTTIVNPGFFRTDLLTPDSTSYATPSIPDYADRHAERVQWYQDMNGHQEGDPAKLAQALLTITSLKPPPRRFIALAAILDLAVQKAETLKAQADAFRDVSSSLAHDDA
jgi:NAD(P)-dependent dehydrogenase (short-subunit alcohol dehydrogenase family)